MTLTEAQAKVDQWIKTIGVRYYSELTNTAVLMEEVGEVARLMARIYGEQSFKTKEKEASAKDDLAEEMGDVLFVLMCLANQADIDLGEQLNKIMEKRSVRDKERHANNPKLK
jgi:NTP pyrophosphatase (non-canonical NTP hydrolase)